MDGIYCFDISYCRRNLDLIHWRALVGIGGVSQHSCDGRGSHTCDQKIALSTTHRSRKQTMTNARITLDANKRAGRPCIRNLRISVYDILDMMAEGLSESEIIEDFPELETADFRACLAFAASREHNLYTLAV